MCFMNEKRLIVKVFGWFKSILLFVLVALCVCSATVPVDDGAGQVPVGDGWGRVQVGDLRCEYLNGPVG